ncbi:hypothetical protein R3P38DRAFT_3369461 [Favolaschia claudopus]|uniref:Uncharacterized protein n=1 Tax=Favolaschia claudopus TaxID=2862362 RepID=A0AAW0A2Q5_9AGAR
MPLAAIVSGWSYRARNSNFIRPKSFTIVFRSRSSSSCSCSPVSLGLERCFWLAERHTSKAETLERYSYAPLTMGSTIKQLSLYSSSLRWFSCCSAGVRGAPDLFQFAHRDSRIGLMQMQGAHSPSRAGAVIPFVFTTFFLLISTTTTHTEAPHLAIYQLLFSRFYLLSTSTTTTFEDGRLAFLFLFLCYVFFLNYLPNHYYLFYDFHNTLPHSTHSEISVSYVHYTTTTPPLPTASILEASVFFLCIITTTTHACATLQPLLLIFYDNYLQSQHRNKSTKIPKRALMVKTLMSLSKICENQITTTHAPKPHLSLASRNAADISDTSPPSSMTINLQNQNAPAALPGC